MKEIFNNQLLSLINSMGDGFKNVYKYVNGLIVVNINQKNILINNHIYKFEDIMDCTLTESKKEDVVANLVSSFNNIHKKGQYNNNVIKRSLVGGAIAGTPGAIIGGISTPKEQTQIIENKYYGNYTIVLTINDILNPTESLNIGSSIDEASKLTSLFRVIIANKEKKYAPDTQLSLESLYIEARAAKASIDYTDTFQGFILDSNFQKAEKLYTQIFYNDFESPEAKFYFFYFSYLNGICLDYNDPSTLFYEQITTYIRSLKSLSDEDFRKEIKVLLNDIKLIAIKLGRIDDEEAYNIFLSVGDIVLREYGEDYGDIAANFWEKGIEIHNLEGYVEDISIYISLIHRYRPNYIEPKQPVIGLGYTAEITVTVVITFAVMILLALLKYYAK